MEKNTSSAAQALFSRYKTYRYLLKKNLRKSYSKKRRAIHNFVLFCYPSVEDPDPSWTRTLSSNFVDPDPNTDPDSHNKK